MLYLYWNQLTGAIPTELGRLANLTWLGVGSNQLTGKIPTELGGLANLAQLSLWATSLTGEIPLELGNLSNLEELSLSSNQLTGAIPAELGGLANLEQLWLAGNELIGEIPTELGNLGNLQKLFLFGNQLTGCIPVGLRGVTDDDPENDPDNDLDSLRLPFCDVLLGGLSISPRALTPAFDPLVTIYTALEGSAEVTVAATNDHDASIRFLDENDAEIPDGDATQDGLQVDLDSGITMIKIEVTSVDGDAVHIYAISLVPISACVSGGAVSDLGNAGLVSDCEALLASRDTLAVAGDAPMNWSEEVAIEQWEGITVDTTSNRVTRLELRQRGLSGEIPEELGDLSALTSLDLRQKRVDWLYPL